MSLQPTVGVPQRPTGTSKCVCVSLIVSRSEHVCASWWLVGGGWLFVGFRWGTVFCSLWLCEPCRRFNDVAVWLSLAAVGTL